MKLILASLLFLSAAAFSPAAKTIYDFKITSLDGADINFADFKGKKILVVNTASMCGYTKQYAGL